MNRPQQVINESYRQTNAIEISLSVSNSHKALFSINIQVVFML